MDGQGAARLELLQHLACTETTLPEDASLWAALTPGARRVGGVMGPARGGAVGVAISPALSGREGLLDALPHGQRAAMTAAAVAVNAVVVAATAFGSAATPGRRVVVEVVAAAAASQRIRL